MSDQPAARPVRRRSPGRKILFSVMAVLIGLIFLEGVASFIWIAVDFVELWNSGQRVSELTEERHCEYDDSIGWINRPDARVENIYGPGRSLTINTDGVRALEEYGGTKPEDRFRVICLGDSFTLGYGVDDADTFPQMLDDSGAPALQVVNMGQGGYSVGQSYLWLKRMHSRFEPNAVVCIFITEDFRRLGVERTANGYSTPRFREYGNRLFIENVPVPPRLSPGSLLLQPGQLSSVLKKDSSLVRSVSKLTPTIAPPTDEEVLSVGVVILRELAAMCHGRGCQITLVLIPTKPELQSIEAMANYKYVSSILSESAARQDVPFLDVRPAFEQTDIDTDSLFLEEAFQHYSEAGNRIVADSLADWLPVTLEDYPVLDGL